MYVSRAVLDTNLVVRIFITARGLTGRLMTALADAKFKLAISEPMLRELAVTMRYPRVQRYGPFTDRDLERIEGVLRRLAVVVPGAYTDLDMVPTDAKDNPIVACALESTADYIVTDDRRDLLPLKVIPVAGYKPIQIVAPGPFLRLLG